MAGGNHPSLTCYLHGKTIESFQAKDLPFPTAISFWLLSFSSDEASAKEEAQRHIEDGSLPYTKADVVVKLGGWDIGYARDVAQGCLSALQQLTLSDKQLAGVSC